MPSAQELSRVLQSLYAVPAQPALWPKVLKDLTEFLSLPAAAILYENGHTLEGVINVSAGLDTEGAKLYGKHYHRLDEYRRRYFQNPKDHVAFAEEFCPMRELSKTEFFNDFLARYNTVLLCMIMLSRTATTFEDISLYYDPRVGYPGNDTLDRLSILLPHIKSALNTQRHLLEATTKANDLAEALHLLHTGLVLLDENCKCFFVNKAAERIFERQDGLVLRDSRLVASIGSESSKLQALIGRVCGSGSKKEFARGGAIVVSRHSRKPLQIQVSSFLPENLNLSKRAVGIVLISDPEQRPVPTIETLRSLYGLTPSESRLAVALAKGKELRQICDEASITYATGRAHLRNVFAKTGARRQTELISLLPRTGLELPLRIQPTC